MATLTDSLRHVKAHFQDLLPDRLIRQACRDVGHRWRDRRLDPTVTTYRLLQQVLDGNPAVGELRHHSRLDFSDSAYCQGREARWQEPFITLRVAESSPEKLSSQRRPGRYPRT